MKTIVKVIAAIAVFGGGFFAYQSVNAADITGDAGVSYSDTRTFRGVKQADDTLGVTVGLGTSLAEKVSLGVSLDSFTALEAGQTNELRTEVSLGYDTTQYSGVPSGTSDSSDMWFVGLQWQDIINADDKIGFALAQPTMHDDETNSPLAYELYYSYKANDSVTVTPTIFGGTDREGTDNVDIVGALVQTVFKF